MRFVVQESGWQSDAVHPLRQLIAPHTVKLRLHLARQFPSFFAPPTVFIASRPDKRSRTEGAQTFYQDVLAKRDAPRRNVHVAATVLVAALSATCVGVHVALRAWRTPVRQ